MSHSSWHASRFSPLPVPSGRKILISPESAATELWNFGTFPGIRQIWRKYFIPELGMPNASQGLKWVCVNEPLQLSPKWEKRGFLFRQEAAITWIQIKALLENKETYILPIKVVSHWVATSWQMTSWGSLYVFRCLQWFSFSAEVLKLELRMCSKRFITKASN